MSGDLVRQTHPNMNNVSEILNNEIWTEPKPSISLSLGLGQQDLLLELTVCGLKLGHNYPRNKKSK